MPSAAAAATASSPRSAACSQRSAWREAPLDARGLAGGQQERPDVRVREHRSHRRRPGPGRASSQRAAVASWRVRRSEPRLQLDQVGRPLDVARGERVPDRLRGLAVRLPPGARTAMELGHVVGMLVEQPGPEQVGEQVVIAVPAAPVVERDEEQVGPLERLEHRRPAGPAGDRVAQRAGEPVEDRRSGAGSPAIGVGLPLEDLVGEVVDDVAVVARELTR